MKETGFLLIDKPADWTSHDVVGYLRGVTKIKKIGHAGTLDPFATGLLIVGVGRPATKRLDEFKGMKKEYIATVQLGATSDTQDLTGTIQKTTSIPTGHQYPLNKQLTKEDIKNVLKSFVGKQQQIPPMYSAKKVKGKKLYELARRGEVIERQPIDIEIYDIHLIARSETTKQSILSFFRLLRSAQSEVSHDNSFTIRVSCSTGTYIRTLCHDIGQALGTGAYCSALRRTKIGKYSVKGTKEPKQITKRNWKWRLKQL